MSFSPRSPDEHPGNDGIPVARSVVIPAAGVRLQGDLSLPDQACGVVLFAHGSGSSRHSPRNRFVARSLVDAGIGTLLFDLMTPEEEDADLPDGHLRFDIEFLAERLVAATGWAASYAPLLKLGLGYFGASTGGAAALVAAAALGRKIQAVVSRGGRPDLAGTALPNVASPTLFIVGGHDEEVLELNRQASAHMRCEKKLVVVPGATHLFEEPGTLEAVASLAAEWFRRHLRPR